MFNSFNGMSSLPQSVAGKDSLASKRRDLFKLRKADSLSQIDFLIHHFKKCDSTASISSTESFDWDDRKRTISDNIRKKLGNASVKKPPDSLMSGVNLKEALVCQFPDGTEEIGSAQKGKTLREMLSPIFDRRNMSMNEFAVFIEQSNTPLKYSFDTFHLAGQTLLIQGNHYVATNEFTYSSTTSATNRPKHDLLFARSLHDPDTPDNSGNDRLNRSSSLEMVVDNLSSIKRTHSEKEKHETESSEHSTLTSKAKSITEQLERITYNLNISEGIPTLEYKNWTELLPESVIQSLGKKEEDQQHHIWELVTTEHNYITTLSTIINTLLGCLRELHNENYLTKINENDVFLNIEDIRRIHLIFWNECVVPLIQTTKDTGEPLNPEIFTGASTLFEEELNPLFEYCINYHESRNYIKSQQHKNNDFKEYINWCNNQIRLHHNKLGIDDMLIKPIQRIQKYPIIIRDILKKTTDDDTKCVLSSFHEKVRVFVESLNRRKEEKEESQKIEGIKDRIESYSVLPSSSSQTNDQINQILSRYTKFDLSEKVPLLNTQRKFLHENTCKMSPTIDAKAQDITLFLFSDHILITRPNKKKPDQTKKKTRIIKQPLTLDRVVIEEMKDLSHTSLIVYLNEYGSLVDMFLLQSSNQESHTTLLNAVIQAKDHYIREKNKLYTELDAGKSVSSTSVNSAGNFLTTSPAIFRHPPCSITRSSSEHYPPARRTTTDPASSVARAQSMPASNERRNLVPPSIASSSSSSASSSSSSVSEAPSSDKMGILSDIKESDKSTESGTDEVPANEQTNIIPALVKTIDADVYISDNLSTEFSNNMDLNKGICDSVNKDNTSQLESDKLLFSKTDALYIDHHQQSES